MFVVLSHVILTLMKFIVVLFRKLYSFKQHKIHGPALQ